MRSINAVISPDLVRDIGASAADLGLITSAFFFSFALFQIPLGLLLDRFDPKKVGGTLLLFGVAGTLVFAWGRTVPALVAGRALIGIGFSGALMSPFVANVLWFPKDRVVLANSVILAGGGLGGLASTVPIEYFLRFSDWRTIFVLTSGLIALASAMILLFVPARAPEKSGKPSGNNGAATSKSSKAPSSGNTRSSTRSRPAASSPSRASGRRRGSGTWRGSSARRSPSTSSSSPYSRYRDTSRWG